MFHLLVYWTFFSIPLSEAHCVSLCSLLKQHRLVVTLTPCCVPSVSSLQLIYIPWQAASLSASCCCAHLVLGDLPGRGIDAKLLQRVDDLASWTDGDRAVEDKIQMVDAGILGAEEEGTVSVSSKRENPLGG